MASAGVQDGALPVPTGSAPAPHAERVYPMSRQGRRQAILLSLGVASIWIFALWSLITILQDGVSGVEWVSLLLMLGMIAVAPVVAWTLLEEANSRIATSSDGIEYRTLAGINLSYGWGDIAGFKSKEGRGRIARFFLGEDSEVEADNNVSNVEAVELRPGENNLGENRGSEAAVVAAGVEAEAQPPPAAGSPGDAIAAEADDVDDGDGEPETLLLQVQRDRTGQISNPIVRFLHNQAHGSSLPIYGGLEDRQQLLDEIAVRTHFGF